MASSDSSSFGLTLSSSNTVSSAVGAPGVAVGSPGFPSDKSEVVSFGGGTSHSATSGAVSMQGNCHAAPAALRPTSVSSAPSGTLGKRIRRDHHDQDHDMTSGHKPTTIIASLVRSASPDVASMVEKLERRTSTLRTRGRLTTRGSHFQS